LLYELAAVMATEEDDSYLYEDLYGGAEEGIAGLSDSPVLTPKPDPTDDNLATESQPPIPEAAAPSAQAQPIQSYHHHEQQQQQRSSSSQFQGPSYTHPVGGVSAMGKMGGDKPMNVRPSEMPDEGQVFFFLSFLVF
jgi:hypothetical protein